MFGTSSPAYMARAHMAPLYRQNMPSSALISKDHVKVKQKGLIFTMLIFVQAYRSIAFGGYGFMNFTKSAFLQHAKSFNQQELEIDMTGKVCLVTGANAGIGYAAAEALAARGAIVYLVCRSKERGQAALSSMQSKTGNGNIHLEICELSSLRSVKDLASRFIRSNQPLHVLIHNAGVMENQRKTTEEGLEYNFAVNVGAPYTLTELLLPALEKTSSESRVITVSSGGMYGSPLVKDLQYSEEKFDGLQQYARNKRLQIAMTEHWAASFGKKGLGFYSMHPGWVDTESVAKSLPGFKKSMNKRLRSPEQGADTIVWLAMQPKDKLNSGAFYFDRKEAPKHLVGCRTAYTSGTVDAILVKVRGLCGFDT